MNFVADFGAKNEGRLSPFEFDNPKDAENSPFEASSVLIVKAKFNQPSTNITITFNNILVRGQFTKSHRASCVKLLG